MTGSRLLVSRVCPIRIVIIETYILKGELAAVEVKLAQKRPKDGGIVVMTLKDKKYTFEIGADGVARWAGSMSVN